MHKNSDRIRNWNENYRRRKEETYLLLIDLCNIKIPPMFIVIVEVNACYDIKWVNEYKHNTKLRMKYNEFRQRQRYIFLSHKLID